jgi:XrtN system VIT domain protein
MPTWARLFLFFIYGIAIVVFTYLSLYLMPLYLVSIVGLIALGISIHTFVPAFFVYYTIQLAGRLGSSDKRCWWSFASGIVCSFIVCVLYVVSWSNDVNRLNNEYSRAMVEGTDKLPLWIQLAQRTESSGLTEKILKTDIIYTAGNWSNNFLWSVPKRNFSDEQRIHDPLVVIANFFSKQITIPEDDRVSILKSQYDKRHQALDRLWTGQDLKTEQVTTNIRMWPEMHLAYTEKFITVYNYLQNAWGGQEEAIYTLHMPEGAVVTSLSLWINSQESKAILTSKGKADTAYSTIVGYERRDPSVVHWQEGNTVTIRVFPVPPRSSRTFKVGITAPLRTVQGQLAYDNIWFEGPDAGSANEKVKLEMNNSPKSFISTASYRTDNNKIFTTERKYRAIWSLRFDDLGLKQHSFSFNGYTYSILPYSKERVAADFSDIFLDINNSWSAKELEEVWKTVKQKKVWIYNDGFQVADELNHKELFDELMKQQFSLFPFHLVRDKEHSLVVSKSGHYSPNISDLEGSPFLTSLRAKIDGQQRIKIFHLGNEFSPYLRSLKEFRLFDFECGDTHLLQKLFEQGKFVKENETDNAVVIHSADVRIIKTPGETASDAPDHLMRLFAYNHIMQEIGASGLTKTPQDSTLVDEAQTAYVVSPVSSLVVLEKQEDYDRFGIKDKDQSLKNASLKNSGAVPEPAEWALIILVLSMSVYFIVKWKLF